MGAEHPHGEGEAKRAQDLYYITRLPRLIAIACPKPSAIARAVGKPRSDPGRPSVPRLNAHCGVFDPLYQVEIGRPERSDPIALLGYRLRRCDEHPRGRLLMSPSSLTRRWKSASLSYLWPLVTRRPLG
jgi:hypothetical protein